jgi:hypothetical protein
MHILVRQKPEFNNECYSAVINKSADSDTTKPGTWSKANKIVYNNAIKNAHSLEPLSEWNTLIFNPG